MTTTYGNLALAYDRPAPQPEQIATARPALQVVDAERLEHFEYECCLCVSKGSNRQTVSFHKPGRERLELTTLYAVAKNGIPSIGLKGLTQIHKVDDYRERFEMLRMLFATLRILKFQGIFAEEISPLLVAAELRRDEALKAFWRKPHQGWRLNPEIKNLI